jgi:hypothetical protein
MLKTRGSLLHYPFEGNATDVWGGNNGTVSGATLADGKFGQCYNFDGSNDKITSTTPVLGLGTGFTALLWWKYGGTVDPSPGLLGNLNGHYINRVMISTTGTSLSGIVLIGAAPKTASITVPNPTLWHRVGLLWDTSKLYAVCDSVLGTGTVAVGVLKSGTAPLLVGTEYHPFWAKGLIDEVTIYTRALGIADLKRDMLGLPPIS